MANVHRWTAIGWVAALAAVGGPTRLQAQEIFRYPIRWERIHVTPVPPPVVSTGTRLDLSGRVRDHEGRPLAGVEVIALGMGRVAVTDGRGGFRLARMPEGTVELQFRNQGFELTQRVVTVDPNLPALEVSIAALGPTWCPGRWDHEGVACPVLVKGYRAAERPDER